MGLKVEGSSPSIHPISNESFYNTNLTLVPTKSKISINLTNRRNNILRLKWLTLLTYFFRSSIGAVALNQLILNPHLLFLVDKKSQLHNPLHGFKSMYVISSASKSTLKPLKRGLNLNSFTLSCIDKPLPLFKQFKVFLKLNLFSNTTNIKLHYSWSNFFIQNKNSTNLYVSVSKLFIRWKQFYYLMYNIFFYKLKLLFFSNSFFRAEVDSLNWLNSPAIHSIWRHVSPFLTYKSTKIFNYGWLIFYRLKLLGYNTSLVMDTLYHIKTLYYLNKFNYFTLGLVPVNYASTSLNVALPSSSDNFLTQLYFLQFLTKLKKNNEKLLFQRYSKLWINKNL